MIDHERSDAVRRKPMWLLLAVLSALALFAAACGSDDGTDETGTDSSETTEAEGDGGDETTETTAAEGGDEETTESTEGDGGAEGEALRIAIVAPSASTDLAFTQSMVDAVDIIGQSRSIEVEITDGTFVVEDAAAAIRGYAEDGFDLVIAHGSQYGSSLSEIAPDYPDTSFAWGTSADTFDQPNIFAYTVQADEGGYAMGAMAAALTESGVIGVVGPIEVGDAKLYVDGFVAGAAAQDPAVTVNVNYIESFSDVALAAEAAEAHVANGADVMTGSAQMVVGAVGVANDASAAWFGTQANQTSLGPDIVVASQVYHWEVVLDEMLNAIEGGTLGGETYVLTFANDGLVVEYNDAYGVADDIKKIGDEAVASIADGSLSTGVSEG
jgi:basic membrane protein A